VYEKLGKKPCYCQVKVAQALYMGRDVMACAPTGARKTLTFWIPVLMSLAEGKDKMMIVITPLNLLGRQNKEALDKAGLKGIAISCKNANPETFKEIEAGKYNVVIINPEILMGNESIEDLWKKAKVTK
ncbi:hypothetical protein CPB84DRAFT_1696443, partial [Gymnopilus junonius]